MAKRFEEFNSEIVPLFKHYNNTDIARQLLPRGNDLEIGALRKHISELRIAKPKIPKNNKVAIKKRDKLRPFKGGDPNNILFIGDLHCPFDLDNYLKFCREQQEKYDCGTVIFIGDVIDNHYSSYHESDPDGFGAGEELERAIDRLSNYYHTFPEATVIIGNHDRLVYRKAFSGGISKRWIREYKEVLNVPKWHFVESLEIFNVNVNHGEGGTAKNRIKSELQSQVQGHLHTNLYVEFLVGSNFIVFGMQVGCGVDNKSYALAYGKNYRKPAIGCGVLLSQGTLPIAIPMKM